VILVDPRAGSEELVTPLRKMGVEIDDTHRLPFGDLVWDGRGEKGKSVSIGVEFKKLEELVAALRSERLQGYQMRGMRPVFDHSYLLIEGELLYDRAGALQQRRGKKKLVPLPGQMSVSELFKRVFVLHLCGGLNPIWTVCREDTLQAILALYRTWTDKDLDQHKSHIAMYEAPPLIPISEFRRTVRTLPGIGMRASLAVEEHFKGNLWRASAASVEEWASIAVVGDGGKTKRLGTTVARRIYDFCHGGTA
jgi:ERCC4-type nuclease